MYAYICVYVYVCVYIYIYTHTYIPISNPPSPQICLRSATLRYSTLWADGQTNVCMYVCIYVCMYIYIYIVIHDTCIIHTYM